VYHDSSLGRCSEIGIINPRRILYRNGNTITTPPASLEVVVLKVERSFVESIPIRYIMDSIGYEEGINPRGVQVREVTRVLIWVEDVDEIERTR
jgi:hypothetical protein